MIMQKQKFKIETYQLSKNGCLSFIGSGYFDNNSGFELLLGYYRRFAENYFIKHDRNFPYRAFKVSFLAYGANGGKKLYHLWYSNRRDFKNHCLPSSVIRYDKIAYSSRCCSKCTYEFLFCNENKMCLGCACDRVDNEFKEVNLNDYLSDYSTKNRISETVKKSRSQYMGFEYEVIKGNSFLTHKSVGALLDKMSDLKMLAKHDGSVYGEFVSDPFKLDVAKKTLKAVNDELNKYRFLSWDGEKCGFHVHVNKKSIKSCSSLKNFFTRYLKEFKAVSGRKGDYYCRFDEHEIENNYRYSSNRYVALNFINRNTVEFRCWRGSMNYERLSMYLDLTSTVCKYSEKLDNMNFKKLIVLSNNKFLYDLALYKKILSGAEYNSIKEKLGKSFGVKPLTLAFCERKNLFGCLCD